MPRNASDALVAWGVDVVFGMPGDGISGINGVMEAIRTHSDQIRFVQVRHEESAALMACAYAMLNQRLERKSDCSFLGEAQKEMHAWRDLLRRSADRPGRPMKP